LTARDPDHGRSMHIAYLVNQYPKVSHTFIRREINALEARGVQVTRLAIRPSPDRLIDPADLAEVRQTRCILGAGPLQFAQALVAVLLQQPLGMLTAMRAAWSMGRRSERALLKHAAYLLEACVLRLWLRSQDIDHVHVHFGTNSAAVALLSHLMGGGDYSLTVHGPEEFDMPSALALEDKIRHARFVVAISSFCRSQLYRWTPPDQWHKIQVVHCALESESFADDLSEPPAQARLVCIGRLSPEKGQTLLLQAIAALHQQGVDVHLTLAGDGPMRGHIDRQIADLGLHDLVRVTGWIDNQQVRREIQSATALVLTSFAEGLPVVIMEAFALGKPVLATQIAGIGELVVDGRNGWLIPAGDATALQAALLSIVRTEPAELQRLGRAALQDVTAGHLASTEAARLHGLLLAAQTGRSSQLPASPARESASVRLDV
jgi:colanic acid/amylovoran biosynthesis glycosyltransferase